MAMADMFERKLATSYRNLQQQFTAQVDVPEHRRFIGFDAYRMAIDCLNPGDWPPDITWSTATETISARAAWSLPSPVLPEIVGGNDNARVVNLLCKCSDQQIAKIR